MHAACAPAQRLYGHCTFAPEPLQLPVPDLSCTATSCSSLCRSSLGAAAAAVQEQRYNLALVPAAAIWPPSCPKIPRGQKPLSAGLQGRGGSHSLALAGTVSASCISHRGPEPLCEMQGAGSVRATAGRWQPLRPNCRQTAIAGRLTHRGATGCRPRLGDGRAARPGHRGGRGAAPLCVWSSTTTQLFHRDRPRGSKVSQS